MIRNKNNICLNEANNEKKNYKNEIMQKYKNIEIKKEKIFKNYKWEDMNHLKLYNLKNFAKNKLLYVLIIMIVIYSHLSLVLNKSLYRRLYFLCEILLTINGTGDQHIFGVFPSHVFNKTPSVILVNGKENHNFRDNKILGLSKQINNITVKWNYLFNNCEYMFYGLSNIINIDLSNFDSSKVTKMLKIFQDCTSLTSINLKNLNTSIVEDMRDLFVNCKNLKSIDVSDFNTKSVTKMSSMFYGCSSLTSLDLSNFDTSKTILMTAMFQGCDSLLSLDLNNFNTSIVTDMSCMFKECKSLKILKIDNFRTSSVTTMQRMFSSCRELISLNITNFDTHLVNNMEQMFFNCKKLKTLDFSNFNTSLVTTMYRMFGGCSQLIYLNLRSFNTKSVNNMVQMFNNCSSIISLNIDNFDTSKVNNMYAMFANCSSLISLNLNNFNTKSAKNLSEMFTNINQNLLYCFNEAKNTVILSILKNQTKNYLNNCSNICFEKSKTIKVTEDRECVYDCMDENHFYSYEFDNICYKSCPKGLSIIIDNICKCNPIKFFNKSCNINSNDINENNNMIKDIINELMNGNSSFSLYSLLNNTINKEQEDLLVNDDNIKYQLTSTYNQNNKEYSNISTIFLGDCEDKLKNHYHINESLIIFKVDYMQEGSSTPIVEYEVYHPFKNERLNLSICEDTTINISIPVSINESEIFKYNLSSEYYNDICYSYTTEYGTDIVLTDRVNEYYKNNMVICEENCEFIGYNKNTKKAICACKVKKSFNFISDFNFDKNKFIDNIIDFENIINFNIMKCFKTFFTKEGFINNIGSYILLAIIIMNIPFLFYFSFREYNILRIKMEKIIKKKRKAKNFPTCSNKKIKKKNMKENNNINEKSIDKQGKKIINGAEVVPYKTLGEKLKEDIYANDSKTSDFMNGKSNRNLKISTKKIDFEKKKSDNNISKFNAVIYKSKKKTKEKKYNDYEINELNYNRALKADHRTFNEYYISLLKRKQIILFTFYTNDDYNSKIIKLSLFLFSFSSFYAANALFFNDSTMHKIYIDEGEFNFIYQIPQILYSAIISAIFNSIIKYFCLSEKNILEIKKIKETNKGSVGKIIYEIKKCLIIKFTLYFLLNFLFLIFFWYYLGCFCAVYKNTQIHLIKDTLISFSLSLIYPFGLCLIPGCFRIPSLNSQNHDRKCMYNLSKIIQLI